MPVHRFQGSGLEMGRAHGRALRSEIAASKKTMMSLERVQLMRPRWAPMPMFDFLSRQKARQLIEAPIRKHYPRQAEYYDGLAQGSGAGLGNLLLLGSAEILLSKIDFRLPAAACSAAAVPTSDGLVLHKNFDYPEPIRPYYFIRGCRPDRGYATLEFTVAPLAGAVDGLNERGLAVAYDYAFCTDEMGEAVPLTVALNEMLRTCADVSEAIAFLRERPRCGGALLLLADPGQVVSVELSHTRMQVRRPDARGWISHTNHYRTASLREVQIPEGAIYGEQNVAVLRGQRVHESSFRRGERLERLLESGLPPDADRLWGLMSDHDGGPGADDTICRHGAYWETTAAIQLLPAQRRIRFAWGKPCGLVPESETLGPAAG